MTKAPKLKWEPSTNFPGEFEFSVGCIEFSVASAGQWDVCVRRKGGQGLIIIDSGDAKSLAAAKRKCQRWLDRQWKAMQKLAGDAGQ